MCVCVHVCERQRQRERQRERERLRIRGNLKKVDVQRNGKQECKIFHFRREKRKMEIKTDASNIRK